ncbi:MAG: VWA domain-containing protein [Thermoleophilaceae bacterium]
MSFGAPLHLLALVLVPLAIVAYAVYDRRRARRSAAFTGTATIASVAPDRAGWRRHAPIGLYALAFALLVVAFARPERTVAVPDGRAAVMLVTDKSASMRATDVRPERITAIRRAARRFLDDVPDEVKVGSVAFDSRVRRIEAPRIQRAAVRESIDALEASGGTATGDALEASMRSLERARGPRGRNPAALVLLSDGFSTSGADPIAVARKLKRRGIRVYTVALGTQAGTIEVERADGSTSTRDVPPDRSSLREIASITGGRAYSVGDRVKLEEIYGRLGKEVGTRDVKRQVTAAFAGAALLLVGAGALTSLRLFGRLP